MPEESYYVRVRGRIGGPYKLTHLKQAVKQGKLARIHEISADKVNWFSADSLEALFPPPPPPPVFVEPTPQSPAAARPAEEEDDHLIPFAKADEPAPRALYYYERGGSAIGPVSPADLRALAQNKQIEPHDLICREGDTDWVIAGQSEVLASVFLAGSGTSSTTPTSHVRDDELIDLSDAKVIQPTLPTSFAQAPADASGEQFDQPTKIAMGAGGLGLLILALSPLFKWVNLGGGGVTGIAGDGRIVLGLTALAIVVYGVSVLTRKRLIAVSLGVGAWGTVALFWMGGLIWEVGGILNSADAEDNPFAAILATQVSPGAGLYLGLLGGLVTAAALGYLGVQRLRRRGRLWLFYVVQTAAVLAGVLMAVAVGMEPG